MFMALGIEREKVEVLMAELGKGVGTTTLCTPFWWRAPLPVLFYLKVRTCRGAMNLPKKHRLHWQQQHTVAGAPDVGQFSSILSVFLNLFFDDY